MAALKARQEELAAGGYVSAVSIRALDDPRRTALRQQWWDSHFATAEYQAPGAGGEYQQMPDDNTPARSGGQALSGNRRTHRVAYSGAGVTIRMPSATAIRRFEADSGGQTFDVPVSYLTDTGESHSGWVRVTRSGNDWAATGLGFGADAQIEVSEAVSAIMEARRPTRSLREVGNLLAHRKDRTALAGAEMVNLNTSTWISGVSYDDATGVMGMTTRTAGRAYGYQVPRATFEAVAKAHSPGAVYNRLIKSQPDVDRVPVKRCGQCGRFFAATDSHTCPLLHHAAPADVSAHNAAARLRASGTAPVAPADAPAPQVRPQATQQVLAVQPQSSAPARAETNIDVRARLRGQWSQHPRRVAPLYGDHYGWTASEEVTSAIGAHSSSRFVPRSYSDGRVNGDDGIIRFAGAGAAFSRSLYGNIPASAATDRHHQGPSVRLAMSAAARHPGVVEVGGYVVGPSRQDERISVDEVYLFDDAPTSPLQAWTAAQGQYQIGDASTRLPTNVTQVQAPWRPGEKAWKFSWA